jgi:hypothetical protein
VIQPEPDVWLPRVFENPNYTMDRVMAGVSYLGAVGRLRENQSLAALEAEADSFCASYKAEAPNTPDADMKLALMPFENFLVSGLRPSLLALLRRRGIRPVRRLRERRELTAGSRDSS